MKDDEYHYHQSGKGKLIFQKFFVVFFSSQLYFHLTFSDLPSITSSITSLCSDVEIISRGKFQENIRFLSFVHVPSSTLAVVLLFLSGFVNCPAIGD